MPSITRDPPGCLQGYRWLWSSGFPPNAAAGAEHYREVYPGNSGFFLFFFGVTRNSSQLEKHFLAKWIYLHRYIYISIYLSIYPSIYLSIYPKDRFYMIYLQVSCCFHFRSLWISSVVRVHFIRVRRHELGPWEGHRPKTTLDLSGMAMEKNGTHTKESMVDPRYFYMGSERQCLFFCPPLVKMAVAHWTFIGILLLFIMIHRELSNIFLGYSCELPNLSLKLQLLYMTHWLWWFTYWTNISFVEKELTCGVFPPRYVMIQGGPRS